METKDGTSGESQSVDPRWRCSPGENHLEVASNGGTRAGSGIMWTNATKPGSAMLKMIRDAVERTRARRKRLKRRQRLIDSLEGRESAELASLQALNSLELAQDEWERREAEGISHLQTVRDEIKLY